MTTLQWLVLALVATVGHVMAGVWYLADQHQAAICKKRIYALDVKPTQWRREFINSLFIPLHAVLLAIPAFVGFFAERSTLSFWLSLLVTFVWAEVWHYVSHRAMHRKSLLWIHREHHKSQINTPLTALSFSFSEKIVFDVGLLLPLMLLDALVGMNFYGIATWFIGYLVINSFSHANFEFRPPGFNRHVGQVITTTTYHALHHSRYTGNYGLGTRVLDRWLGTEWPDYEAVYQQITAAEKPLGRLKQRVDSRASG